MSNITKTTGEAAEGIVGGSIIGAHKAVKSIVKETAGNIGDAYDAYNDMRDAQKNAERAEHEADIQQRVVEEKRRNPGRSVQDIRNEVEREG